MRIIKGQNRDNYTLWLSAQETDDWRSRPGAAWPCSTIRGRRLYVAVDSNGIFDFTVGGKYDDDIDGNELDAIVSDHLPADLRHLWPVWGAK